ncbi:DUF488 family protein [Halovenus sp. WSH3]|uniref:DUF488 family protein n=1 Tax=Halovenus carboxidivorans TaxID=2692199 RepID=A0A6B0T9N0_9EURY|nr:DUF488 domain-containing protein [Halovenus carboxidivorans]MXR52946.1 DUF488 family protein [Halovenus carboxidivorans]
MTIRTKRIYEEPSPDDGRRVLVDRLWPRGVSKEQAQLDDWHKEIAPSEELREWFDHDPERFGGFRERYRDELADRPELVRDLLDSARSGTLTLLYAATDEQHNNAVVLAEYLDDRLEE